MKSLILDGSVRKGNTSNICKSFISKLKGDYRIENSEFSTCKNCSSCFNRGCIINDTLSEALKDSYDYIFLFSSVYFFGINAKAKAMLDRLYSYKYANTTTIVLVTVSGSETDDLFSGINLIRQQFSMIKEYCGFKDIKYLNFVTNDNIIQVDEEIIAEFIKELK